MHIWGDMIFGEPPFGTFATIGTSVMERDLYFFPLCRRQVIQRTVVFASPPAFIRCVDFGRIFSIQLATSRKEFVPMFATICLMIMPELLPMVVSALLFASSFFRTRNVDVVPAFLSLLRQDKGFVLVIPRPPMGSIPVGMLLAHTARGCLTHGACTALTGIRKT